MTDPLGFISRPGVNGPGQPIGSPSGSGSPEAAGPSFKDMLMQNIRQVNSAQQEASAATEDLMSGKRTDLEGVLLATQKADAAFRMLVAVRNKVQTAYDEIKQLRV
jgi:flagellar hook-basal body complex protein FliE